MGIVGKKGEPWRKQNANIRVGKRRNSIEKQDGPRMSIDDAIVISDEFEKQWVNL
jgi:hypothetical protein